VVVLDRLGGVVVLLVGGEDRLGLLSLSRGHDLALIVDQAGAREVLVLTHPFVLLLDVAEIGEDLEHQGVVAVDVISALGVLGRFLDQAVVDAPASQSQVAFQRVGCGLGAILILDGERGHLLAAGDLVLGDGDRGRDSGVLDQHRGAGPRMPSPISVSSSPTTTSPEARWTSSSATRREPARTGRG
jgi:hypothetical protein